MKHKISDVLAILVINTTLIAMDSPQQQPWWHNGKSGLCQLYREIPTEVIKVQGPAMALTVIGNNQWWYSDFKVSLKDPLNPPVALSDDGTCMAAACKGKVKLYDTQTGYMTQQLDNRAYVLGFRDKLVVGCFDCVQILNQNFSPKLMYDLDEYEIRGLDFNNDVVATREGTNDIVFYDINSRKKTTLVREDYPKDLLPAYVIDWKVLR